MMEHINFPLVLSLAVLLTGLLWLVDSLLWKPKRAPSEPMPVTVEYARSFFPVLFVVFFLRSFLVEPYQIPSGSMIPTLEVGDFILVNKYVYGVRLPVIGTKVLDVGEPARGEVMVFVPRHSSDYFIKRVVGLPGDKITYKNKTLYINDERLSYTFEREFELPLTGGRGTVPVREYTEVLGDASHPVWRYPGLEPENSWQVPQHHYFMMGDNRGASFDSRGWGTIQPEFAFVPESNIVGRAFRIWMHMPGWSIPSFERNQEIR